MSCSRTGLSPHVQEFTLDVYKYVVSTQPTENAVMSIASLMVVMAMVKIGAKGNTERQMATVLKLESIKKETLLCDIESFIEKIKEGGGSVQLKTANKIYPHVEKVIREDYIQTLRIHFDATVKGLDYFRQSEESRLEINSWVDNYTNGFIKDLLPPGSLNPLSAMVLVNAIYFKGGWDGPFDPRETKKSDFYISLEDKIQVDMMEKEFLNEQVTYHKIASLDCQVLELMYTGEDLGMVFLLPNEKDGLLSMEQKLTPAILKSLMSKIHPRSYHMIVNLPKFTLEGTYDMKAVLSALGMTDLFHSRKADLSDMGEDLHVSDVFHKAYIQVNEEGTEAAAASGDAVILLGDFDLPRFAADHPFFFMIWDHRLDVPLFVGRFTKPGN